MDGRKKEKGVKNPNWDCSESRNPVVRIEKRLVVFPNGKNIWRLFVTLN